MIDVKVLAEVFLDEEVRPGLCLLMREGRVAGIVRGEVVSCDGAVVSLAGFGQVLGPTG